MLDIYRNHRVLLLQGPMGPFFRRFAQELEDEGALVKKINFNAGDAFFYDKEATAYRGSIDEWAQFVEQYLNQNRIDDMFLFGDCRPYHKIAVEVCKKLGTNVYVFEEGYLRPDFITLERGGVNGYSAIPRDPEFYRREPMDSEERPIHIGSVFWRAAYYSMVYALAVALFNWRYPEYKHHRDIRAFPQAYFWLRGGVRKLIYGIKGNRILKEIMEKWRGKYFLVPLQVHNDFQIQHSRYTCIEEFIEDIVASFAKNADKDISLVIKHHPMDLPYKDYSRLLKHLAQKWGIENRLFYLWDQHLPTLLRNALGTVVINSTVGLSSIHHGTSVKAMGDAVYDISGLSYQKELDTFWKDPEKPDRELYRKYRGWLLRNNQANGNYYKGISGLKGSTGVRWFE